jgi:hypothetical protein
MIADTILFANDTSMMLSSESWDELVALGNQELEKAKH